MNNFIPYQKLSKKQKEEINKNARKIWGQINPTTKKINSKKLYNRKKNHNETDDFRHCGF